MVTKNVRACNEATSYTHHESILLKTASAAKASNEITILFNRIVALCALSASVAALPEPVSAQESGFADGAPVAVTACHVTDLYVPGTPLYESSLQNANGTIELAFIDTRNVPATTVTLVRTDGRYSQRFVDKGTFSLGVKIDHFFAANDDVSAPDATCSVTDVDFIDGSSWHAAS